ILYFRRGGFMEWKFLVDIMLGRLARWLRTLGYDAFYTRNGIDSRMMVLAYRENRFILTRSKRLYNKIGPELSVFINSDDFRDQVREVINVLGIKFDRNIFLTRCLNCNLPLMELPKEDAQLKVPPYVFQTVNRFRACPQCRRVFWSGTHISEMEKLIDTFWERKGDQ
ncbi:Mut7-C RNAse domain-containing protein, partial [bacterium]|nr:Mut7-C RNAse domain-containing protein [bacterium]